MNALLTHYERIGLDEMKSVKLMNRIDTKYVTSAQTLRQLLRLAADDYRVQAIDGGVNLPYYTLYFGTTSRAMYMAHLHGKKNRQKVRLRRYESSDLQFLEVKHKSNTGRTDKQRIPCPAYGETACADFLAHHSAYPYADLQPALENRFNRITLVNKAMTERVTIDTDLRFHNPLTGNCCRMTDLAVIELKRDGNCPSPLLDLLRQLRVFPASFSKYCIGMVVTDPNLVCNNFKPQIHRLDRAYHITPYVTSNFN
jgi:hypothetical protein